MYAGCLTNGKDPLEVFCLLINPKHLDALGQSIYMFRFFLPHFQVKVHSLHCNLTFLFHLSKPKNHKIQGVYRIYFGDKDERTFSLRK